jgi:hypothetical protein
MIKKIFVVTYVMLVVCVAMTAPTWAANTEWTDAGANLLWGNSDNWKHWDGSVWTTPVLPNGTKTVIGEAATNTVTLSTGTYSISVLEIYSGGILKQTGGSLSVDQGDAVTTIGDNSSGTLEISGSAFHMAGEKIIVGLGSRGSNTLRIIGSGATINAGRLITGSGATGTLSLVMDAGGISPINTQWGDNDDGATNLVVNLDAYAVPRLSSMTLINVADGKGTQGAFSVAADAITQDGTPLTLGADPDLLIAGQYFIDYAGGTGGNDVVLSVNLAPVGDKCGAWGYLDFDKNKDCVINLADFAEFAELWLACTMPNDPACNGLRQP